MPRWPGSYPGRRAEALTHVAPTSRDGLSGPPLHLKWRGDSNPRDGEPATACAEKMLPGRKSRRLPDADGSGVRVDWQYACRLWPLYARSVIVLSRFRLVLVLLIASLAVVSVAGCQQAKDDWERSEDADREQYRTDVFKAWSDATGESATEVKDIPRDQLSESHSIMASMILMGNGMESDLSTYKTVYLVEFKDASGTQRAAVVADGKVVLPADTGSSE